MDAMLGTRDTLSMAARAPALPRGGNAAEAGKAAQDFEAFFLSQMVEEMFAGMEPDALFGGGQGESVFRSLLLQEYGKAIAHSGGVGIADAVQKEILKLQEAQS
jgi:Rod binding domain-containing protein